MPVREKRLALILLVVAITALLLIAMSLPALELRAGTPFPSGDSQENFDGALPAGGRSPSREYSNSLLKGIIALVFLVSFFYVMVNFVLRLDVKRLLRSAILLILFIALLKLIPSTPMAQPRPQVPDPANPTIVPMTPYPVSPLEEPPQTWTWVVLGVLIAAALFVLGWLFLRRTSFKPARDPVLQEAEIAVNAIEMGEDLKSVILRCYQRMSRILQDERGIEREEYMTAREFMELLQARGISPSPVRQLTLLFEAARYGALLPGEREEQIGLECLNEIIRDSQRGGE